MDYDALPPNDREYLEHKLLHDAARAFQSGDMQQFINLSAERSVVQAYNGREYALSQLKMMNERIAESQNLRPLTEEQVKRLVDFLAGYRLEVSNSGGWGITYLGHSFMVGQPEGAPYVNNINDYAPGVREHLAALESALRDEVSP